MKTIVTRIAAGAALATGLILALPGTALAANAHAGTENARQRIASHTDVSDTTLVKSLPGFRNAYADVNGLRLHYVIGGKGEPLVLLPGWPETW